MKIIEGMKELKLLRKKMNKNRELIQKYASQVSTEKTYFESKQAQTKEVKSLLQSNADMCATYMALKVKIEKTNLATEINFKNKTHTISELLMYKRVLGTEIIQTYKSLNSQAGDHSLRSRFAGVSGKDAQIERFYSESEKNEQLEYWSDFIDSIDGRLEVVNATTDLID